MEDCVRYDRKLLDCIPYENRKSVENVLKSIQESHVMLKVVSNAFTYNNDFHFLNLSVIGSFGRMDGCVNISDYDILYLYEGDKDETKVVNIQKLITKTISENKALLFDHRNEIESEIFDFNSSPAYPILSFSEIREFLSSDKTRNRAIQIITEGRCISNSEKLMNLKIDILNKFGFSDTSTSLDFSLLINYLNELKNSYFSNIIDSLSKSSKKGKNIKILKLFSLREFFYLSTLFALAEIAIGVSNRRIKHDEALRILSAPSILKVTSYANPIGNFILLLRELPHSNQKEVTEIFMLDDKQYKYNYLNNYYEKDMLINNILKQSLAVTSEFDTLLSYLHDPRYLTIIDKCGIDYLQWSTNPKLVALTKNRDRLINISKKYADSIIKSINILNDCSPMIFDEAIRILNLIKEYKLINEGR